LAAAYTFRKVFQLRRQAASCTSQGPGDVSPSFILSRFVSLMN
jgi:hypothetical protein